MNFQLSHFLTILQLTILYDGITVVAEKENSKNFSSSGRKKLLHLYNAEDTDESHHRRAKGLKSRKRNNRQEELAVCDEERKSLRDMLESTQDELKIAKDMSWFTDGGTGGLFSPNPDNNSSVETVTYDYVGEKFQTFTVPVSGTYLLEVVGAEGGGLEYMNFNERVVMKGGRGALISGHFYLTAGDELQIAVGEMGRNGIPTGINGNDFYIGENYKQKQIRHTITSAGGGGGRSSIVKVNENDGQMYGRLFLL